MSLDYVNGPTVMMTLGGYQFGLLTAAYQELRRVSEFRWAVQGRFMQDQALQFVGFGADTMTLSGVVFPEFKGGTGQIADLRDLASGGEPLTMIDGNGTILGNWALVSVEEVQSVFAAAGVPRKQEYTLSLHYFGEVDPLTMAQLAANAANDGLAALAEQNASGLAPANVIGDAISSASALAGGITGAISQVQAVAGQIGAGVATILAPLNRAYGIATGMMNAAMDAKSILGSSTSAIAQASSLGQLLSAANSAAANSGAVGNLLASATKALGTVPADATAALVSSQISVNKLTVGATATYTAAKNALAAL